MITCFSTLPPLPIPVPYYPHRFAFPNFQSPLSNPQIPVTITNWLLGPGKCSLWTDPHTYSKGVQFQSKCQSPTPQPNNQHTFLWIPNLLQKLRFWIHPPPQPESPWLQASQILTALWLTARRPPASSDLQGRPSRRPPVFFPLGHSSTVRGDSASPMTSARPRCPPPDLADPSPGKREPLPFRPHLWSWLPAASRVPSLQKHKRLLFPKAIPLFRPLPSAP